MPSTAPRAQVPGATIHFYSPERSISNFGTLKGKGDLELFHIESLRR